MIVVDTSALIAILQAEPTAEPCAIALAEADIIMISAATLAEAMIVSSQRGLADDMDALISTFNVVVIPVDQRIAKLCFEAYCRFGKRQHPAGLNFGDCSAYALAQDRGCPLLFVGNDFSRTDIRPAI